MTYERNIYCLEGNWNKNPRSYQSVKPMLELLRTFSGVKYIYHKCTTKEEFFHRLHQFTKGHYKNYSILYLGFHGRTNRLIVENECITLKEIANALESKLEGKIVHFSLKTYTENDILVFKKSGYTSSHVEVNKQKDLSVSLSYD